ATVTVTENSGTNAGTNGSVTVCDGGAAVDLFAQLGGTPDAGGTWSGPSAVVGGNYDPATMVPGVYTYTVTGVAPCVSSSATVTVTENSGTNAGTNGSVTVCDGGAAVDLFAQLGGTPDAGGTWSGPSAVVGGNYDPATMAPGVYTYTVTGVAPCTNATATVTVTENTATNAGTDGTLTVCSDGVSTSLFAQLGGTPDAGGTWSGPSAVAGGNYDPTIMDPGVYTYTVTGIVPCIDASASVTVLEEVPANSGASGQVSICTSASPIDLFLELGGAPDAGGSWTGPSGPLPGGVFDPAIQSGGTYTYTVGGNVCPASSSEVEVELQEAANAGVDNSVALCNTGGAVQLIDQLLGTPDLGGNWQDLNGAAVSDVFDPLVQSSGDYRYILEGNPACPGDTAVLTITVNLAPLAGINGALAVCANSASVSLFDGLGGTLDAGGVWTAPDGTPHATVLDPLIDPAGTYTYTVTGIAPCPNATATVNVTINPLPYAGEDGTAAYCSDGVPVSLLSVLGGVPQPSGIWTGPGGLPSNGLFAPGSSVPGVYSYTVSGPFPCGSDQAEVTITVTQASNAGSNASISLCAQDDPEDLFTVLGGIPQTGGTWSGPDGSPFDGTFDPASDPAGAYTYSVAAISPCVTATAIVQVSVVPPPVASINVLSNGSCAPATVILSHAYTGPGSCTWILGNGSVVQDCAPVTVVYDDPGSYDVTLIIDAGNGCGADTLTIEDLVTVFAQPEAGFTPLPGLVNTLDPVVFFDNTSSGAIAYTWSVDGVEAGLEEDLRYTFPEQLGATYTVCLVASASPNCVDSVCQVISVDDGLGVFVPNSFSPNGDEINETFQPVLVGIDPRFFSFIIFDRWGLEVFNASEPGEAWSGRNPDGTECPVDVYVWRLVTKDAYSGARIERFGHVNLVR
ncbi:MAG: gliding motility-associated C-terminal domain-containing protein, partial [Flavobacteriales bacterium]